MTALVDDPCASRTPRRRLRDRVWRVAAAVTHPLEPADYLDMIRPLRSGADLRGRIVDVRPETADAVTVVHPARTWLARPPAGSVRPDRRRRRRGTAVARLLADLAFTGAADGLHHDHRRRRSPTASVSNHLVQQLRPGTLVHLDQAAGDFVLPDPAPAQGPVRHRGQRHHPGDGHAAQPGSTGSRDVVVVHSAPAADDVIFGGGAPRCSPRHGRLRLVEQHTDDRRHARRGRARRRWSPDWPSARPGPAARPACSTPSRSTGSPTACPTGLHTERFRPDCRRPPARAAPSRFTESATVRRRRRRDPDPRRRRGTPGC